MVMALCTCMLIVGCMLMYLWMCMCMIVVIVMSLVRMMSSCIVKWQEITDNSSNVDACIKARAHTITRTLTHAQIIYKCAMLLTLVILCVLTLGRTLILIRVVMLISIRLLLLLFILKLVLRLHIEHILTRDSKSN